MIKGVTYAHLRAIWYLSETSDFPSSLNQFLGWDFFAVSYSKPALETFCNMKPRQFIDLNHFTMFLAFCPALNFTIRLGNTIEGSATACNHATQHKNSIDENIERDMSGG